LGSKTTRIKNRAVRPIKKFDDIFSDLDTIHDCDGQTPDDNYNRAYTQRRAATNTESSSSIVVVVVVVIVVVVVTTAEGIVNPRLVYELIIGWVIRRTVT